MSNGIGWKCLSSASIVLLFLESLQNVKNQELEYLCQLHRSLLFYNSAPGWGKQCEQRFWYLRLHAPYIPRAPNPWLFIPPKNNFTSWWDPFFMRCPLFQKVFLEILLAVLGAKIPLPWWTPKVVMWLERLCLLSRFLSPQSFFCL